MYSSIIYGLYHSGYQDEPNDTGFANIDFAIWVTDTKMGIGNPKTINEYLVEKTNWKF